MSGIGSMMMTPSTAEMYTKILANMAEMNKQHSEAMKKYAESRQEAQKTEYKQQLEALESKKRLKKSSLLPRQLQNKQLQQPKTEKTTEKSLSGAN